MVVINGLRNRSKALLLLALVGSDGLTSEGLAVKSGVGKDYVRARAKDLTAWHYLIRKPQQTDNGRVYTYRIGAKGVAWLNKLPTEQLGELQKLITARAEAPMASTEPLVNLWEAYQIRGIAFYIEHEDKEGYACYRLDVPLPLVRKRLPKYFLVLDGEQRCLNFLACQIQPNYMFKRVADTWPELKALEFNDGAQTIHQQGAL